jgi:membrane-associated phospholipid phosphatase
MVVESLTRPYPLSIRLVVPVVALMLLVPFYLVIAERTRGQMLHVPELALDHWVPTQPAWSLVYGSHLVFVFFPVLVIRQEEQIRRTFLAYLMVWSVGYVCFLAYPTIAPRTDEVVGEGFFAWSLRLVYSADPPRNCFPSLHVAHAFVSALTCYRLHPGVGIAAGLWASLIAVSTLFTKQHYVADVIAGIFLACAAYVLFLRSCPREVVPELDRRVAPVLMLGLIGIHGLIVAGFWIVFVTAHVR